MSTPSFIERHPYEAGFSRIYAESVLPFLESVKERRAATHRKALALAVAAAALCLLVGAGAAYAFANVAILLIAAVGAFIAGQTAYRHVSDGMRREIVEHLAPILCDFIGGCAHTWRPGAGFVDTVRMRGLGILAQHDSSRLDDGVAGVWNGVGFRLAEAELRRRRSGKNGGSRTVFRGLLFEIDVPVEMPKIVFLREHGMLNGIAEMFSSARRGLERLEFPQEDVERTYSVYTDDVNAATARITPEFGRALLDISREQMGAERYLGAAFESGRFYLALELKHDFLDFGSMTSSVEDYEGLMRQALTDLMIPRRVIDGLLQA